MYMYKYIHVYKSHTVLCCLPVLAQCSRACALDMMRLGHVTKSILQYN